MTTRPPHAEVVTRVVGYRRLDRGSRLRHTMKERGLTIMALAEQTRLIDPAGVGVNWRLIGFLTSQGRSARETCSVSTAELIAEALNVPVLLLFKARTDRVLVVRGVSAYRRIEVDAS